MQRSDAQCRYMWLKLRESRAHAWEPSEDRAILEAAAQSDMKAVLDEERQGWPMRDTKAESDGTEPKSESQAWEVFFARVKVLWRTQRDQRKGRDGVCRSAVQTLTRYDRLRRWGIDAH
jgi:hypothetical protein